ncbi:MAG TPA: hypothetical protein VFJ74_04325 [Gemmatimonadaceae bacterium]|nr:hypothetical protein [Gemmatimonadaceae bacterium]
MTPLLALRVAAFAVGAAIALGTLGSAIRAFILPRAAPNLIPKATFRAMRALFDARARFSRGYAARDRVMALYAPVSLVVVEAVWLWLEALGFTAMFWALRVRPVSDAFHEAVSSITTLGFRDLQGTGEVAVAFAASSIGLVLVALLIGYLPTMYTVFSRRETLVATLDSRAGVPPSGVDLLARCAGVTRPEEFQEQLNELWAQWELWFADIEETHTSLPAITYFRSPQPQRCWVTAAGAVLDAAALTMSTLKVRRDGHAALCLRSGFRSLERVAEFFDLEVSSDAGGATRPISVTREEFDAAYDYLDRAGVPVQENRDEAWRGFASWRGRYDAALLGLCDLVMAPEAPWSSDRSGGRRRRIGKREVGSGKRVR